MNEVEKMRSSQLADMSVPEIQVKFEHAKRLLAKMRVMDKDDADLRKDNQREAQSGHGEPCRKIERRRGIWGRACAFATDCAPHWAPVEFCEWSGYSVLWKNLVDYLTD